MATQKPDAAPETGRQDYPILAPFRLQGRWHHPEDKTLSLSPAQAYPLMLNEKVGEPLKAK
ncbi:hypothetical protein, partial [Veronia pacifica]